MIIIMININFIMIMIVILIILIITIKEALARKATALFQSHQSSSFNLLSGDFSAPVHPSRVSFRLT